MTSLLPVVLTKDFDTDSLASGNKLNSTDLDAQLAILRDAINAVQGVLNPNIRSDDTFADGIIRSRMLHQEVAVLIAAQGGWQPKIAVACASTGNLVLSGEQTIDGVLTAASRVLVKDQTLPANNGIYVTGAGAWTRATDADTAAELGYAFVPIGGGTTNSNTSYVCTSATAAITLGVTALTWTQLTGTIGVVPIGKGGSGATTAATARTAFGISAAMDPVVTAADLAAGRLAAGGLIPSVLNIAALKALSGTNLTGYVQVAGFTTAGDGGGGLFRWVAADAATANDGTIVAPTAGGGRFYRMFSGAFDVRWFGATGDGVTNDSTAIQATITAATTAGGGEASLSGGTYRAIGLLINANVTLSGVGRKSLIQSPIGITTGTIIRIASTVDVVGAGLRDLELRGPGNSDVAAPTNTVVALDLGTAATWTAQAIAVSDVVIAQVHTGVRSQSAFTNVFTNVLVSQCFLAWDANAATNDCSYIKCSAINCRKHLDVTTSEGLHWHSPLFQNSSLLATEGAIIDLYQSNVTLIGPYFENVSPDRLATVGTAAESITTPSHLTIIGGQVNQSAEAGIRVNSPYAKVIVEGLRHTTTPVVVYGGDLNAAVPTTIYGLTDSRFLPIGGTAEDLDGDIVAEVDGANQRVLVAIGGGGPVTTSIPHPDGYRQVNNSLTNVWFGLATGLATGEWYTLILRVRRPVAQSVALQALTAGVSNWSTALDSVVTLNSAAFRTYHVPFKMNGDELRIALSQTTAIDIQVMQVVRGIQLRPVPVMKYGIKWNTAAPATGTWERGSLVMNNTPTVGQPKAWACTVAGTSGTWVSQGNL